LCIPIYWSEEDHEEIKRIAYYKWIDAGCPPGDGKVFWELAEAQKRDEVLEVTFPRKKKRQEGFVDGYFYEPYIPLS
jgi:hypothetical protein